VPHDMHARTVALRARAAADAAAITLAVAWAARVAAARAGVEPL
jgi:hypothetical protein